jgi:hypothetical protein
MCIPSVCGLVRTWWEQIGAHDIVEKSIASRTIRFIIEHTKLGWTHACSPEAVCALVELVPADDWLGIECFVFRQSTSKQKLLTPVWGRLSMAADIGQAGKPNLHTGPAILIEATNSKPLVWSRSLEPEFAKELERLRDDGHTIIEDRRSYHIQNTPEAVRSTQLYRTVLHEIGHWVDWLERVERPSERPDSDYSALADAYWSRPTSEREAFAHNYADRLRRHLILEEKIPLPNQDVVATSEPLACR